MKKTNALLLCIFIAVFVLFIDQTTKLYVQNSPAIQINDYLRIETYYNYGLLSNIALSEGGIITIGMIIILLFIIKHEAKRLKKHDVISMVFFGLITGGLTSHALESWFRGEIIDFIVIMNPIRPVITNIADISLLIGVIGFIIISIPYTIHENKNNRKIVKLWIQKRIKRKRSIIVNILSIIGSIIMPAIIIKKFFDKRIKKSTRE